LKAGLYLGSSRTFAILVDENATASRRRIVELVVQGVLQRDVRVFAHPR
jgi:hypothetical protein